MMATDQKTTEREAARLDVLLNVPLEVTAELGRCSMPVADVLKLGTGSIVELDRMAGGPVDIYVNNKLFARGEVVAVDENFGVRVTELLHKTAQ
jgi:flagellar motor switch protein FliN/FliY